LLSISHTPLVFSAVLINRTDFVFCMYIMGVELKRTFLSLKAEHIKLIKRDDSD